MVKVKRVLGVIIILALLVSSAPFMGQAVAVADDLLLREGPPLPAGPQEEYVPDQIIVKFKETTLSKAEVSMDTASKTLRTGKVG
jgi:hypothetical protein